VARIGEKRSECRVLVRQSEGSIPVEVIGVCGMVILKWMLKKGDGRALTRLNG
jgi:hypothetical protein